MRWGEDRGMDKQELAKFLRSRRGRLRPVDVGLTSTTRRRTPGLRREEVAVLAHISTEYYVRLEQGRAPRPSPEVLAGISGALRLTGAESEHLHILAGVAKPPTGTIRRVVRSSILTIIERLPQTAAIVMSADLEVLAWNPLAAALMEDFAATDRAGRNLARQAFPPDTADLTETSLYGISDVAEFRHYAVMRLRMTLAQYPADLEVAVLVVELRTRNAQFARLWARHDVRPAEMLAKTFNHPVVGPITVDCDTLAFTDADQFLVLYTAAPETPAADALALLQMFGDQVRS